jgi:transposase-like protein
MEDLALEFRRGAKERRAGRRYSEELRQLAVEYARQARELGHGRRWVAKRLGLSDGTVISWLRGSSEVGASGPLRVHEVKLTEPAAAASQPVLVMPSGARVEGLSMSDLVVLLGALR